ncbi:2-C-methyl-D-erythritol 4-phosphate cytidylyltransferase, partial [Escherichia coli]|uniref:IspD/TarI family cytidylyltransferase n=1 Tax=Escherichia coli TaxID=562 RepID=UPI00132C966B
SQLIDRTELRAVQTPQGFDREVLLAAHRRFADTAVTDDAALCELFGEPVRLVDGSTDSLKITQPLDVDVAEALLTRRRIQEQP